jgi:hypothetical protein
VVARAPTTLLEQQWSELLLLHSRRSLNNGAPSICCDASVDSELTRAEERVRMHTHRSIQLG